MPIPLEQIPGLQGTVRNRRRGHEFSHLTLKVGVFMPSSNITLTATVSKLYHAAQTYAKIVGTF